MSDFREIASQCLGGAVEDHINKNSDNDNEKREALRDSVADGLVEFLRARIREIVDSGVVNTAPVRGAGTVPRS